MNAESRSVQIDESTEFPIVKNYCSSSLKRHISLCRYRVLILTQQNGTPPRHASHVAFFRCERTFFGDVIFGISHMYIPTFCLGSTRNY
jgi:hypothetical protein